MKRDGDRCRWCGEQFSDELTPTIDHVIPRSLGGTDRLQNLVLACAPCNGYRSNLHVAPRKRTPASWLG